MATPYAVQMMALYDGRNHAYESCGFSLLKCLNHGNELFMWLSARKALSKLHGSHISGEYNKIQAEDTLTLKSIPVTYIAAITDPLPGSAVHRCRGAGMRGRANSPALLLLNQ